MTNHGSLVARLYKARYYPRCNFFESTLGHNPSYVILNLFSKLEADEG